MRLFWAVVLRPVRTEPASIAGSGAPVLYNPDAKEFVVAWAQLNADANGPAGIRMQRIDTNGALQGGPSRTSDGADEDWPALAYNSNAKEYVLTYGYWGTGAQARAQRFTPNGLAIGAPVVLANASGAWIPQATYDPAMDRYLVVASLDGKTTGQIFDPTLKPAGSPFAIQEGTLDGIALFYEPRSHGFFAVLQGSSSLEDYAVHVSGAGVAGPSFVWTSDQSATGNFHPRAAYNSKRGEWLAVTSKDLATSIGQRISSP